MKARNGAVFAVFLSLLVLGSAACGSSSGSGRTTQTVDPKVVAQHWKAGLVRWHHVTQHALNGISLIFSTESSLVDLGTGHSKSSGSLTMYEHVLIRCTTTIKGLGPVPPGLELAGRYALETCAYLEKGERGVEALVVKLRHGQGYDTLDPLIGAGSLLSSGQAQLTTTMHALNGLPT
jgi:hypothetical protein